MQTVTLGVEDFGMKRCEVCHAFKEVPDYQWDNAENCYMTIDPHRDWHIEQGHIPNE